MNLELPLAFTTESLLPSITRAKGRIVGRIGTHHENIWSRDCALRFDDISPSHIRFGNQSKPESESRENI
jgi:hypothetical protein